MTSPADPLGQAQHDAQLHRLQDTYDLGKADLGFKNTTADVNYNDQLALMKSKQEQGEEGFRTGLAMKGVMGAGAGNQQVLTRGTNYDNNLKTLAKNYFLQKVGFNQQQDAMNRQLWGSTVDANNLWAAQQQQNQINFGSVA